MKAKTMCEHSASNGPVCKDIKMTIRIGHSKSNVTISPQRALATNELDIPSPIAAPARHKMDSEHL